MFGALKRTRRVEPKVDLTPLIDCAFILLIFFAVAATLISTRSGMEMNLPKAATVDKMPQHIQISIAEDNSIFFEDLQVNDASTLGAMVNGRITEEPDIAFIIGAAESVPYERLMTVLDTVRLNGGEKIALQAKLKVADDETETD